jgi:hypothetical protein
MRFTKRRTGCLRELKKFMSPRATRSTGICRRAIWRAISGRNLGVGQHLVEQGGDDVDDDLVERGPAAGAHQFVAVGADLVDGHQRAGKAGHVQADIRLGAIGTQPGRQPWPLGRSRRLAWLICRSRFWKSTCSAVRQRTSLGRRHRHRYYPPPPPPPPALPPSSPEQPGSGMVTPNISPRAWAARGMQRQLGRVVTGSEAARELARCAALRSRRPPGAQRQSCGPSARPCSCGCRPCAAHVDGDLLVAVQPAPGPARTGKRVAMA